MKHVAMFAFVALGLALSSLTWAQDRPPDLPAPEDLDALLAYLDSAVPEHRNHAEALLREAAPKRFDELVERLPMQPVRGRELLLNILVNTDLPQRIPLCVTTLCRQDARRKERLSATEALRKVEPERVLAALRERLEARGISEYERVQCYRVLGELTLPQAQALAERERDLAPPDSLRAYLAEDALLRSVLADEFAQNAWSRYQRRHKDAPKVELKLIAGALDALAQPVAVDRAEAEFALFDMLGQDARVWLALSRSIQPERAAFALSVLRRRNLGRFALAAQAVMLDLATSGERTVALLAVDVAVAGTPPTAADLKTLQPVTSGEAMRKLEAVLEGLTAAGNLAELRERRARLESELVPLLRQFGPAHDEARELMGEIEQVGRMLDTLERIWRRGWRREFEADILGLR